MEILDDGDILHLRQNKFESSLENDNAVNDKSEIFQSLGVNLKDFIGDDDASFNMKWLFLFSPYDDPYNIEKDYNCYNLLNNYNCMSANLLSSNKWALKFKDFDYSLLFLKENTRPFICNQPNLSNEFEDGEVDETQHPSVKLANAKDESLLNSYQWRLFLPSSQQQMANYRIDNGDNNQRFDKSHKNKSKSPLYDKTILFRFAKNIEIRLGFFNQRLDLRHLMALSSKRNKFINVPKSYCTTQEDFLCPESEIIEGVITSDNYNTAHKIGKRQRGVVDYNDLDANEDNKNNELLEQLEDQVDGPIGRSILRAPTKTRKMTQISPITKVKHGQTSPVLKINFKDEDLFGIGYEKEMEMTWTQIHARHYETENALLRERGGVYTQKHRQNKDQALSLISPSKRVRKNLQITTLIDDNHDKEHNDPEIVNIHTRLQMPHKEKQNFATQKLTVKCLDIKNGQSSSEKLDQELDSDEEFKQTLSKLRKNYQKCERSNLNEFI